MLDRVLQSQRYLAGEAMTAADFAIASPMIHAEVARFPVGEYPALARLVEGMRSLPAWAKAASIRRAVGGAMAPSPPLTP